MYNLKRNQNLTDFVCTSKSGTKIEEPSSLCLKQSLEQRYNFTPCISIPWTRKAVPHTVGTKTDILQRII